MNCKAIAAIFLFATSIPIGVFAQDRIPMSFTDTAVLAKPIPTKTLPPVPQKRAFAKSSATRSAFRKSLEVGTAVNVNAILAKEGCIDTIGGVKVTRMSLKTNGALSVALKVKLLDANNFDDAKLFVYTPDRDFVAQMVAEMSPEQTTLLPFIPGDEAVVEINQPVKSKAGIEVTDVIHSEVSLVRKSAVRKNESAYCNVDVACPAASGWVFEKNAVVKIGISTGYSVRLCTGALINNTAHDKHPYLLTAHHCITNAEEAKNAVFYFGYEATECGGGYAPNNKTISGATLVASGQLSGNDEASLDFSLLELSKDVPESYEPYFAGWDIRKNPIEKPLAVGIHHPQGDPKKISISNLSPIVGDYVTECEYNTSYDKNTHWHVLEWAVGTTEGGSSGSPLFNANHSIIGTLTGGYADCGNSFDDYYSMISAAWDSYPDKSNQLKHWLDPRNVGDSACTGMTNTDLPVYVTLSKNYPCEGEKVTMKVAASAANFTLSNVGAEGLDTITENGTYEVIWNASGDKKATFSINNSVVGELLLASVIDNPEKPVIVRDGRTLSINYTDMSTWYLNNVFVGNGLTTTVNAPGKYKVEASNSYGCSAMSDAITITFADRPYADSLVVYPVPVVNGKVKVRTTSFIEGKLNVNIYSVRGTLVGETSVVDPADVFSIDLPAFARNGVYILEFVTKKGKAAKKILVL